MKSWVKCRAVETYIHFILDYRLWNGFACICVILEQGLWSGCGWRPNKFCNGWADSRDKGETGKITASRVLKSVYMSKIKLPNLLPV